MTLANQTPIFRTNAIYSFETLAPAILGGKIENARCEGEISYQTAVAMGSNIGSMYRSIYPALPQGTPDIPKMLRYYMFTTQTASRLVLCEQWVDKSTINLIEFINAQISFQRLSPADLSLISLLLKGAGFSNFSIVQQQT